MKHLAIISAGFLSAVAALPATAESSKDAALVRACMPQFSAQNTLSIPEECSYKIGNNLVSSIPIESVEMEPTSSPAMQFETHYRLINANAEELAACAIDESFRSGITMAITKKLMASGESKEVVEEIINEAITEEYTC